MTEWMAALASRGAGGAKCKLSGPQLRELETILDAGPAASRICGPLSFSTIRLGQIGSATPKLQVPETCAAWPGAPLAAGRWLPGPGFWQDVR